MVILSDWSSTGRSSFSRYGRPAPVPTLPIVLVSLIAGIGFSIVALYLAYVIFDLGVQWSAALATLVLVGSVSATAALLSFLHDERTIGLNVGFSCAFTLLLLAFVGGCLVAGIAAAMVALALQS